VSRDVAIASLYKDFEITHSSFSRPKFSTAGIFYAKEFLKICLKTPAAVTEIAVRTLYLFIGYF